MWVYSVPLNNAFDNCTDANKIIHRQAELSVGTSLNIIEPTTFDIIKSTEWTSVLRMCGLSSCPPTSQRFQNSLGLDAEWTFTNAIPRLEHIQAVLPKQKNRCGFGLVPAFDAPTYEACVGTILFAGT